VTQFGSGYSMTSPLTADSHLPFEFFCILPLLCIRLSIMFSRSVISCRYFVVVQENAARTAIAGLATKENFSKVALKKTDPAEAMNQGGKSVLPYKDLMLIQIKGGQLAYNKLQKREYWSTLVTDDHTVFTYGHR